MIPSSRARANCGPLLSTFVLTAISVALVSVVLSGCSDDSTKPPDDALPATPDALVRAFRDAYEGKKSAELSELLSADFEFHFSPADVETVGVDSSWNRAEEIQAFTRMFEGDTGVWPDGSKHAPVELRFPFGLALIAADSVWTPVDEGPLAGTLTRDYVAVMTAQYEDGNLDIVSGRQRMHALEVPRRGFALRSWQDLGGGFGRGFNGPPTPTARVEWDPQHQTSWGFVKAVFRPRER